MFTLERKFACLWSVFSVYHAIYTYSAEDLSHRSGELLPTCLSDLATKKVRLAHNETNPGHFTDQISEHFGSSSQNVPKSDL